MISVTGISFHVSCSCSDISFHTLLCSFVVKNFYIKVMYVGFSKCILQNLMGLHIQV
jgi:hypothetical protein